MTGSREPCKRRALRILDTLKFHMLSPRSPEHNCLLPAELCQRVEGTHAALPGQCGSGGRRPRSEWPGPGHHHGGGRVQDLHHGGDHAERAHSAVSTDKAKISHKC